MLEYNVQNEAMVASDVTHQAGTIVELLRARALAVPNALAYIFLRDGEKEEERLTIGALDASARAVAAHMQSVSCHGDRVILAFSPGLAFIATFLGCLYAGLVPVPVPLPRNHRGLVRFRIVAADCGATLGLTDAGTAQKLTRPAAMEAAGHLQWVAVDEILKGPTSAWRELTPEPDSLAFLQYTSGSTGNPKGVMITHGNLLANEWIIQRAFGHSQYTVFAGWLPLFHDMGLIGNVLQPLFLGIPAVLMSPVAFLQKPYRWLKAISDYRATTSGAPNFAYELCTQKVSDAELGTLDLSCWDVAFNGAEPIRWSTLERFSARFSVCGFRPEAFFPCYGLAETTLFASGGPKGRMHVAYLHRGAFEQQRVVETTRGMADAKVVVGCGRTWEEIRVVDPESRRPLGDYEIGEIWLRGPSVAAGYYGQPELTQQTFGARTSTEDGLEYLRTGDLGFVRNGELFVTGRHKQMMIVLGRNHYFHDIEYTVEHSHPFLEPSGAAAFAIEEDGTEQLVLLQEVALKHRAELQLDIVVAAIQQAIMARHDLRPKEIVLLKPRTLPKTSSGKVQRNLCRTRYLQGQLERFAPRNSAPAVRELHDEQSFEP